MNRSSHLLRRSLRKLYYLLSQLNILKLKHTLQPPQYSVESVSTTSQQLHSLETLVPIERSHTVRLIANSYRKSFVDGVPTIELWSCINDTFYSQTSLYRETQYFQLRKRLSLPDKCISDPVAVLPHMTNHFGHWVGDFIGAIIYYSFYLGFHSGQRKLLVLAPTHTWASYVSTLGSPNHLSFLDPNDCLKHNFILEDAFMLPRISPWQNMSLARNYCLSSLTTQDAIQSFSRRKIFLYSGRSSRIANIDEVLSVFLAHGYSTINPVHENPAELLQELFSAESLWSEHGSMIMNLILSRTRPFTMLAPPQPHLCSYDTQAFMHGGGLYNLFLHGLLKPFPCQTVPSFTEELLHPYQNKLVVDAAMLATTLSLEK